MSSSLDVFPFLELQMNKAYLDSKFTSHISLPNIKNNYGSQKEKLNFAYVCYLSK